MANLRRSLVINFFSSTGAALLQFLVGIALARMLSPSEIGVFSMTVVFVNIAHIFRDFGVGSYLQREGDLTHEKIRSAIGVLFASSWTLALLLVVSSGWIGLWFGEPGIVPVMRVLAIGFLLIPFGSVTNSLLVREYAADKQAVISAAGTLSFCGSCLLFAWMGYGALSMALANLVNVTVVAIVSVPYRPKGAPFLPSMRNWGVVINFGIGTLVTNCATQINNSLPDVLLGKLGSARLVGLFSRANSTVTMFLNAAGGSVTYGAITYLSQAHQRAESLVPVIRRATSLLTGVGWPALGLTALLGRDIVLTLYGAKWLDCVPAMVPLGIAAALSMAFHYTPTALIAIGRPYLGAYPVAMTIVTRIGFAMVLYDGTLRTFGWSMCLATMATVPVAAIQQSRYFHYSVRELLVGLRPSMTVTVICMAAGGILDYLVPDAIRPAGRLAILALPLFAVWYVALRVTNHEVLAELHHLGGGLKTRLSRFAR